MIFILNQFLEVGKIIEILQEQKNKAIMVIEVPRSIRNESGEHDVDVLTIELFDTVAKSTVDNCKVYDIVGVKGKIKSSADRTMQLIAEKVTFLSSKQSK